MAKLNILCVDDQREVLAVVKKDLEDYSQDFNIVSCESAGEALETLEDLHSDGEKVALIICDHIMPGENGIDFLIRLNQDKRFSLTKTMLLTGLATHEDTIQAINEAEVDMYTEKPWAEDEFMASVKKLLTKYFIDSGLDSSEYNHLLDADLLSRTS